MSADNHKFELHLPTPDPVEHLVLCVDDDQNFLKSLEFFLPGKINQDGDSLVWYRFLFFDTPQAALETLQELANNQEIVAMVISDQKMPTMKGTEFLARVKEISEKSIRVLLTGYAGLESAITAINENLLDKYLTKPIENEHDFILSIRHLLQRFRMQNTIKDQERIIHELYEFSNVLNGIEEFQKTLDYIVSFCGEILGCHRISILLYEGGVLKIKSAKGISKEIINSTSIQVGERISGKVFRIKKAFLAEKLDEIPYFEKLIEANDAQSFISIPLLLVGLTSGEQPLGVINVTQKEGNQLFTVRDLEVLTYIANTASIAIHNQINRAKLERAYVESKTQAAALEYQAKHDALTGLPNRLMLRDHLQKTILEGKNESKPFALLLLDLDQFKEINDTLGHHNGDILLQKIGNILRERLKATDLLVRLGGDEFAILLTGQETEEAIATAVKILEVIKKPLQLEGHWLEISASLGLTIFPEHGEDVNLLIQRADVAMYLAKKSRGGYFVYNPLDDQYDHRRLAMMSGLRQAIENNQLVLYYQPKIDLKTGYVEGVEALVRWQHPSFGVMPPDQFIQLAEQTDLIHPLTFWVLNEALHQCSNWRKEGLEISVAVNLSARNLQDEGLPDKVNELLKRWKVEPWLLKLEITESSVMANPERATIILKHLSDMGVRLAIDDFGTGHSSLAYIKHLPAHEIKIDKSFVMSMSTNLNDTMIVNAAIDLGHNLGLSVVAEGVENKEIFDRLAHLGCNVAQGYFMSRPLPPEELLKKILASPWEFKKTSPPDQ